MEPVFLDDVQQLKIEQDGFVVVPLLTAEELGACRAIYEALKHESPELPFYTSHWSPDQQHRQKVDNRLRPILSKNLHPLLNNYRDLYGYFLVKEPSPESFFRLHQDWTLVDETQFTGITAWCPLTDTNSTNGAFHVVRGSHRFLNNVRGQNIDLPYREILSYVEPQFATPIYLKAGEAIIFDQRLWHYSPPNMSKETRISVAVIAIPMKAPLMHFVGNRLSETKTEVYPYEVPLDFLQTHRVGDIPNKSWRGNTKQIVNTGQIRAVEFDMMYKDSHKSPRSVFKNKSLEAEFFETGFVKTPLLSNHQVNACLEIFKEMDIQKREGRYNSLEIISGDHRKIVQHALEDVIGLSVLEMLDEYKFVAFNLAVKRALGDTEFHAHIDDIHVNEAVANSVNCWIPLVDVDEKNGALYFVPKSHKLSQPIRGIGLPFAFEDKLNLILKHRKIIHLRAGEALFFHTKMIHGSGMNNSGLERPAIIVGTIPIESEPIVYTRHDEVRHNQVEKFIAPPNFYTCMEIGKRPKGFQSLGVYDYMPIEMTDDAFESIICR